MNNQKKFSLHEEIAIASEAISALEQSISDALRQIKAFTSHPEFASKMGLVFGEELDFQSLNAAWLEDDFSFLPEIEILSTEDINRANGAYSITTNKIYLAAEFISNNVENTEVIVDLLLEEIGHSIDSLLYQSDTPGDEGEYFAALVKGKVLSDEEIARIKAENDLATVNLNDRIVEIEQQLITGDEGNNNLTGTDEDDTIEGLGGDDTLDGKAGNDSLVGGLGNDNLYGGAAFSGFGGEGGEGGVSIDAGDDTLEGGEGNDYFEGNEGNDSIQGNAGNDTLYGQAGDDTLEGGAGNDHFSENVAADVIIGGEGNDRLDLYSDESGVTVDYSDTDNGTTSAGGTFKEIEDFRFRGGEGDDSVNATAASYFDVRGGAGNDTFIGGTGNDYFEANEGNDSIQGNEGNDQIYGQAGDDTLEGNAGNDRVDGGEGNDVLQVDYSSVTGGGITSTTPIDGSGTISAPGNSVNYSNIEQFDVTGTSQVDNLIGGNLGDTLQGGAGSDVIDGGAGVDSLVGGTGNDVYIVNELGDTITENATEGLDTVRASVDYSLETVANVENLQLTGDADLNGTGNSLNNQLAGNSGNNELRGNAGNDSLVGVDESSATPGMGEIDTLEGGMGGDTFVLGNVIRTFYDDGDDSSAGTTDYALITDFDPSQDIIQLSGAKTDYRLDIFSSEGTSGTLVYKLGNDDTDELIAVIPDVTGLDINSDAFVATVLLLRDNFDAENNGSGAINYSNLANWDVTDGTVDLIGNGFADFFPGNGLYLDLDGTTGNAGRLESKTAFDFSSGDVVTLSFYLGGNSGTNSVTVSLGDIFNETFILNSSQPRTQFARTINVSEATSANLVFDHEGGDNHGLILDSVELSKSSGVANAPGILSFSQPEFSLNEDGTVIAAVTVTRTGGSEGEVGATINLTDGTATAPEDYQNFGIDVSFADGDTTDKVIEIPIVDDNEFEPEETVNLTLSNVTGGATLGAQSAAILTVVSDDAPQPGTLFFREVKYSVNEDGTPVANITIDRTDGSDLEVSTTVSVTGNTATGGEDYDSQDITVTFADGEISKTVTVPIIDDIRFEDTETLTLTLTNPTNGVVIDTSNQTTLSIIDNEINNPITLNDAQPVVIDDDSLKAINKDKNPSEVIYTVTELPNNGNLAIGKTGLSFNGVDDYVELSDGRVSASSLNLPTDALTLEAWVRLDSFQEWASFVSFIQDNGSTEAGFTLGTRQSGQFYFSLAGGENGLTYLYSPENYDTDEWYHLAATYDGSIMKLLVNGEEIASSTNQTGAIHYLDSWYRIGTYRDDNETYWTKGNIDDVRVWNVARTPAEIQANLNGELTGNEAGLVGYWQFNDVSNNIAVDATENGNDGTINGAIPTYGVLGINATPLSVGDTFTQEDIDRGRIIYQPTNNADFSDSFTFNLTDGNTTIENRTFNITRANSPGIVSFSQAEYTINEDGNAIAGITLTRTGGSNGEVTVTINLSDGSAIAPEDYNNEPITVTFADGESSKFVTIPIVDDSIFEATENLNLTLTNPTNGATLGDRQEAILNIVDDDAVAGILEFTETEYSINEDGTPIVAVTVNRTGGSDGAVDVRVNLSDGSANEPIDYIGNRITVNFANGETSKTVEIPVIDDVIFEPDETINLTLSNATGGATVGSQNTATVTIIDNDSAAGELAFSRSFYTVNEDGTPEIEVTVTRSGGSKGEVSATVNLSDNTATAPDDYNSDPVTVTFANNEISKTVSIPLVDDSLFEATETVNLTLSNPTGGATLGTQNTATLNIIDNDAVPGVLNFAEASYQVNENESYLTIAVNRTDGSDGNVSATLLLTDGTATGGDDYLANPITVDFANEETSKTVTIPLIDDSVLESDETINLSLVNPTNGATVGDNNTAVVTIQDNDFKPTLTLDIDSVSVSENEGAVTATITRNTPTDEALEVNLASSDTSELTTPDTVTIPAGESSVTVDLTVVDDEQLDSNPNIDVIATAPGFISGGDEVRVINNDTVNLTLELEDNLTEGTTQTVTVRRDVVSNEPLIVELSSDSSEIIIPDTVTISGSQAAATFEIEAIDNAELTGDIPVTITAKLTTSDTGIAVEQGQATATVTIIDDESPSLTITSDRDLISETGTATLTITRNNDLTNPLTVNLASSDTNEAIVPNSITIPAGESSITAIATGVNDNVSDGNKPVTITATASGLNSGEAEINVTDIDVPDLTITTLGADSPAFSDKLAQFNYKVENLGLRTVNDTWVDRIYLSTDNKLDDSDELLTEFEISANIQVDQFYDRNVSYFNPRTPGTYYLIATTDADNQVDEGTSSGETNNTVITPFEVVPAYYAEVSTDTEVAVTGEFINFEGIARSNEDNSPIPYEFVTIELENNGFTRELSGFTDADGNFTQQFTPLPGEGGTYNVKAFFPDNEGEDTGYEDSFKILGARFGTNEVSHQVIADTPFTNTVSLENLTDTPLTEFTAEVEGAPEVWDIEITAPETLEGDGANEVSYTISAPNDSRITEDSFKINLTSAEGVTAELPVTVDLERITPRLVATMGENSLDGNSPLQSGMLRGEQTAVEITITNEGGAVAENIDVVLPDAPWLSLATPETIESLAPGESTNVTVLLTPEANQDLTVYRGDIVFDAAGNDGDMSLPFEFRAVSEAVGSLQVNAIDELFYFTEKAPKLEDAEVLLRDYFTGEELFRVTTDETGMVNFDELPEGYYTLEVRADDHDTFKQTIEIDAGENEVVDSFLSRQTVKYTWNVTETEIEDRYDIQVESVFETDVPVPTVVVDPPVIDVGDLQQVGQVMQIDMTFTNHGLIGADNLDLSFSEHPFYKAEPLIEDIGRLEAKSSITVPVRITRVADFDTLETSTGELATQSGQASVPCNFAATVSHTTKCGVFDVEKSYTIPASRVDGFCFNPPIFEPRPGIGGFGGGGGGITTPPPPSIGIDFCDPCTQKRLKAIAKCVEKFIPIPSADPDSWINCVKQVISCDESINENGLTSGSAYECVKIIYDCGRNTPTPIGEYIKILECTRDLILACEDQPTGLGSSQIESLNINPSLLEKVNEQQVRLQQIIDYQEYLLGDNIWFEEINDDQMLRNWIDQFMLKIGEETNESNKISTDEYNELLNLSFPGKVTKTDVDRFVERWNRSVDYWNSGIFELSDVPVGQNTDFLAIDVLQEKFELANESLQVSFDKGYSDITEEVNDTFEEFQEALENDSAGVCAKVRIQIDQEATMTRSAFLGELIIENTSDTITLKDITVNLEVLDENGNVVNELFGIDDPVLENITSVDGSGTLATDSTGSAEWTFIPTNLAAKETPTQYSIGGSFSYEQDGQLVTVPLVSTPITVHPQAELYVDYFQQRNVYGDDPFTDATEVAEPFSLGVLVENRGFGDANDLSITSSQPEIVDNEKGLLIDFDIIGSQVNGESITPSLTADFGDIAAGETAVADWLLKSSLQGKFIEYEATFEHVNGLGNPELSLIKEVDIHELIRKVQADGDALPDFLVNDEFDANFYPDILYFSDGTTAPVTAIDEVTVDAPVDIFDLEAELTTEGGDGWRYITLDDPADGQFEIEKIIRSDGTEISGDNIWRTDRTFPATGRPIYENKLHFLDEDSTGNYTIIYDSNDEAPPQVREIIDVEPNPRNTPVDNLQIVFTEPIRANTFDAQDITLTLDDGSNLITDGVSVTQIDPITFQVNNLTGITGNIGQYTLSVDAMGIEDLSGNSGAGTVNENWIFTGDRPAVAEITGFDSSLLTTAVDTFDVTFTEEIVADSFDYQDITLTRNDGGDLTNDTVTITKLDDLTYRVGNLSNLTNVEGDYELLVTANNIKDTDDNNGVGGKGFTWVLDTNIPTLTKIDDVTSPRNTPINSIEVTFDQAINSETFTKDDVTLTLNGSQNLITEDVTVEKRNETTYIIKGLNSLQAEDGEYTFTVNGAAIEDNAGNATDNSLFSAWELDTEEPPLAVNIEINAASITTNELSTSSTLATASDSGQYRVNSQNIAISGDLSEENLQVYLEDTTTGESLGQATVSETSFSADVELSGAGSRTIEVTVVDEAGNTASDTINIFSDVTQPAILEILNVPETATIEPINYIDVVFSEVIDLDSFSYEDITLTRDGGENLITDAVTIETLEDNTYRLNHLTDSTATPGTYQLKISGTTVEDLAGNFGLSNETVNFSIAAPATPEVIINQTQGNTTVAEGGAEDSYTLALATQPTENVTVEIATDDQITTDKTSITFTPENWDQAQNIIITANNDIVPEAEHSSIITHSIITEDVEYSQITLPKLNVRIDDDDVEIHGQVWNDFNGDGIKDSSEPKLADWDVYLDINSNGELDEDEPSTNTDNNGNYSFTNLRPGTYNVSQIVQDGWEQTYPVIEISTTASSIELHTPSEPESLTTSSITTNAGELINLDDFRNDERFANINGNGYASVIIDTGIDLDHPFFGADNNEDGVGDRIVYQYDFADNDEDASDVDGHGSHVASIIGSSDSTYTGIAPEADLIALKVFKDNGSGFFADLEESLQWVYENAETYNIASVNLSLGDEQNWDNSNPRYGIDDELAALASIGVIVTAAAGNNYIGIPGVAYPAADSNTIAVGAVDSETDQISGFSQRHSSLTDVFAPGVPILGADAEGGIKSLGGTSQAAPHIAGIAILAQQLAEEKLGHQLSVTEFDSLLATTGEIINDGDDEVDDVANTGLDFPRVDSVALAEAILTLDSEVATPDLEIPNDDSTNDPLFIPIDSLSNSHTVTLTSGEIFNNLDFGNQSGEDTVDNPPEVSNEIADVTVDEDADNTVIDLSNVFTDIDNEDNAIALSVSDNTNDSLVTATIEDNKLTLDYQENQSGTAEITIVGESNGQTVEDSFIVTVDPVDDAPEINNAIANVNIDEDADNTIIDLSEVFTDIDNEDNAIALSVSDNSNDSLVTVTIEDNKLTLDYQENQSGTAEITIKGESNGQTVEDTLTVTVNPINDSPTLVRQIPSLVTTENKPFNFTIPENTFKDVDAEDNLSYSATITNDTELPSWLTFDSATRIFSGTPDSKDVGISKIKVVATDNDGATAEDIFDLKVQALRDLPILSLSDLVASQNTNASMSITLDNSESINQVEFELAYNTDLLDVKAIALNKNLPASWSLTNSEIDEENGLVKVSLEGTDPLTGSNFNLTDFDVSIPENLAHGASQTIKLQAIKLNGEEVDVKIENSNQIIGKPGDITGNGNLSGLDSYNILGLAVGFNPDSESLSEVEASILADLNQDGVVSAFDAYLAYSGID